MKELLGPLDEYAFTELELPETESSGLLSDVQEKNACKNIFRKIKCHAANSGSDNVPQCAEPRCPRF
jgi:hypothetical protein